MLIYNGQLYAIDNCICQLFINADQCVDNLVQGCFLSVCFHNCAFYAKNYFVVFCKTKHSSYKLLRVVFWYNKTQMNIKLSTLKRLCSLGPINCLVENNHPLVDNFQCSPYIKAIQVNDPLYCKQSYFPLKFKKWFWCLQEYPIVHNILIYNV